MTDLDKLKAKVRALRAKTTAAGCSEAEALAAAEVAARLLAEAGLSDADIEMTAGRAPELTAGNTWRSHVLGTVAHVTNTAAILILDDAEVEFIGRDPGPEIAAYLYRVLVGAVTREVARFKLSPDYKRRRTLKTKRAAVADFIFGLVLRLRSRLLELFAPTYDPEARASAKQALACRHTARAPLPGSLPKPKFGDALAAGWSAGGNVTLAHGVAGPDGRPLAIEGGRS